MIVKPRTRGFICTTAHPQGCAVQVREQIDAVKKKPGITRGPKNVLVIGASTGYGLAARIVAAFGAAAGTIGIYRQGERAPGRTASAGWYNSAAFEEAARRAGLRSVSVTGDAFADETKRQAIAAIREHFGQVDLVVYSVATARRSDPATGETAVSVLKPIGKPYTNKTVNFHDGTVSDITIEPATDEEIRGTVAVMGGDDWHDWIGQLRAAGVLAPAATTIAYSYIGPTLTQPIYRDGSIGRAKDDLERAARALDAELSVAGGRAFVVVAKALVTQSSSAIPVVPLYISVLYKVMKDKGLHEGTVEQTYRLFAERLYREDGAAAPVDEARRIRIDDYEMRSDVQDEVAAIWSRLTTENIYELSDLAGYRREWYQLFGFETDGIDYEADTDPLVNVPNLYNDATSDG